MFLEKLNEAYDSLDKDIEFLENFLFETSEDKEDFLQDACDLFGISKDNAIELWEALVRRVNSQGKITRVKSRAVRSRRATLTTGMSRAALKRRARKAARTKKRNPSSMRKALRKRKKALRRRRQFGIKNSR